MAPDDVMGNHLLNFPPAKTFAFFVPLIFFEKWRFLTTLNATG